MNLRDSKRSWVAVITCVRAGRKSQQTVKKKKKVEDQTLERQNFKVSSQKMSTDD